VSGIAIFNSSDKKPAAAGLAPRLQPSPDLPPQQLKTYLRRVADLGEQIF
jgi:hypothetical protein